MPVHDWTRVEAGPFHHFHSAWIVHLAETLNHGLLPEDFFAMAEQHLGPFIPDVLTFQTRGAEGADGWDFDAANGNVATLAQAPPKTRLQMHLEPEAAFARRRRTLTIRRSRGEQLVAMVEIVSAGNKDRPASVADFVDKTARAVSEGIHLVVLDLLPAGRHNPRGMHGAIWKKLAGGKPYALPPGQPLTLAAYLAEAPPTAFVEPLAVGDALIEMPLFLDGQHYVPLPLEETYARAYRGLPLPYRQDLEGG